jgi:hypothetical protein
MASASDRLEQSVAMSFHGVCPIGPDRTGYPDTPRNVKEGMDGQGTGGKPSGIVFVVQPILIRAWYKSGKTKAHFS